MESTIVSLSGIQNERNGINNHDAKNTNVNFRISLKFLLMKFSNIIQSQPKANRAYETVIIKSAPNFTQK
jgi:hypothetical protein